MATILCLISEFAISHWHCTKISQSQILSLKLRKDSANEDTKHFATVMHDHRLCLENQIGCYFILLLLDYYLRHMLLSRRIQTLPWCCESCTSIYGGHSEFFPHCLLVWTLTVGSPGLSGISPGLKHTGEEVFVFSGILSQSRPSGHPSPNLKNLSLKKIGIWATILNEQTFADLRYMLYAQHCTGVHMAWLVFSSP